MNLRIDFPIGQRLTQLVPLYFWVMNEYVQSTTFPLDLPEAIYSHRELVLHSWSKIGLRFLKWYTSI